MAGAPEFALKTARLGPLPIINHFLDRLEVPSLLETFVPTVDPRARLPVAKGLGVLLRSILVEREPIYRQHEVVHGFAPEAFGLEAGEAEALGDDAIGRGLDRLFQADRGNLLTALVTTAIRVFGVSLKEIHNDSTSISFCGQYRSSHKGNFLRGRSAPWITYGYSKDQRPDLKQLLYGMSTTLDGGIPIHFRCDDGNTSDTTTHWQTWTALRDLHGSPDFLYVADSKLCTGENMDAIHNAKGRFVTVLPRTRREDHQFRPGRPLPCKPSC